MRMKAAICQLLGTGPDREALSAHQQFRVFDLIGGGAAISTASRSGPGGMVKFPRGQFREEKLDAIHSMPKRFFYVGYYVG